VPTITSRQNPIVARFRAAARGERSDRLLLDGVHLVEEALAAGLHIVEAATTSNGDGAAALTAQLRTRSVPVAVVSAAVMQALSPVQSPSPIVAMAEPPAAAGSDPYAGTPFVVMAVDVQDPGNLGAIVRVAEAGGVTGMVCAGACANPFGWKALRGSMGSAFRLPVVIARNTRTAIDDARRHGCRIVAASPREGRPIYDADLRGPVAVLIGGEGAGLARALVEAADDRVVIPMRAPVESLNAAVSAALIVYEARRQRLHS
jgi:TrmH family RNA methyltransferase